MSRPHSWVELWVKETSKRDLCQSATRALQARERRAQEVLCVLRKLGTSGLTEPIVGSREGAALQEAADLSSESSSEN